MADDNIVFEAKNLLRKRLSGKALPLKYKCHSHSAQCELSSLLKRTIEFGESNSVLVIGMKGSGKSTLVRETIQNLICETESKKAPLIVELNGYLQTDDRIALQEITIQLQLENTVGDKVFGSFAETLSFLLQALRSGDSSKSQPILFILEEFDLFTQHRNQTLLYNLFDIAQAGFTPISVVGVTCRLDVMELLEKRVKSRFSHRQLFICNTWTFDEYVEAFSNVLKLPSDLLKRNTKWKNYATKWNSVVNDLSKNMSVLGILEKQFNLSKEVNGIHRLLTMPVSMVSSEHPFITPADISDSARSQFADSKSNMLHGISVLELCLIIAMNHLNNIYGGEPFNFQMVYNEFLKFSQKKSHIFQNHTKPILLKAYEHLIELELLKTKDSVSMASKLQKEYRPMILMVEQSQLKDAVSKYPGCPTDVKQWSESSIV